MSGEWHTGEVVNLCKSYGFIRISKDGKSEDIFFYYGDVKGREPQLGDHVSFELAADAKCRDGKKAVAVEYSRRPRLETTKFHIGSCLKPGDARRVAVEVDAPKQRF